MASFCMAAAAAAPAAALGSKYSLNRAKQPLRAAAAARPASAAGRRSSVKVSATAMTEAVKLVIDPNDPTNYTVAILGDLHMDPRDTAHSYEGRDHVKAILDASPNPFLVSLGDLGESKDVNETKQLFAGTTDCFKMVRGFLDGVGHKYDIVGGNHDLEGIDEFATDKENLDAYLTLMGKKTPQFSHEIAPKVLLVGLGSTQFREATYTSHEVFIDEEQIDWFVKEVEAHPFEDGWQIFMFSHAPIIGSGLRVLQECHVVNGCCWLNHNDKRLSQKFIQTVRRNPQIKGWFSAHFHLSHDYEDSITFPGGSNRGSCVFAQTGVMTARSSRDGRRQSRLLRGNSQGFEVCTVDHMRGGEVRLDATVIFSEECEVDYENMETDTALRGCSVMTFAHEHEDYDHDLWFSAYVPKDNDGNRLESPRGVIEGDWGSRDPVKWWYMKDGAVMGGHNGMIIEYDPGTLAPLGMVVSRDELENRRVAVIDDEWGGDVLCLFDDATGDVTVVQPNEDGSYWRKVVRNKMHRMKEMRRVSAAKKYFKTLKGEETELNVLSSYGPYITTAGQVMGISTKAVNPKAVVMKGR